MTDVATERRDPYLKFFHADWQADEAVQMCSLAARGLWLELLLYMHKAEPYGHLVINGHPPSIDELVRRLRPRTKRELIEALDELRANKVFSETEGGVIVCRRMVRRAKRVAASRLNGAAGGRPRLQQTENLDRNLDGNLTQNLDRNLAPGTGNGSSLGSSETPPGARRTRARESRPPLSASSRHPIFTGQRLTVFDWFLERAGRILGNHLNSFDIDEWFYALDAQLVSSDLVMPVRDGGAWLEAELVAEARRRGLAVASAGGAKGGDDDPYARFPKAWQCSECGEVHEGTIEQQRRRACLKRTP